MAEKYVSQCQLVEQKTLDEEDLNYTLFIVSLSGISDKDYKYLIDFEYESKNKEQYLQFSENKPSLFTLNLIQSCQDIELEKIETEDQNNIDSFNHYQKSFPIQVPDIQQNNNNNQFQQQQYDQLTKSQLLYQNEDFHIKENTENIYDLAVICCGFINKNSFEDEKIAGYINIFINNQHFNQDRFQQLEQFLIQNTQPPIENQLIFQQNLDLQQCYIQVQRVQQDQFISLKNENNHFIFHQRSQLGKTLQIPVSQLCMHVTQRISQEDLRFQVEQLEEMLNQISQQNQNKPLQPIYKLGGNYANNRYQKNTLQNQDQIKSQQFSGELNNNGYTRKLKRHQQQQQQQNFEEDQNNSNSKYSHQFQQKSQSPEKLQSINTIKRNQRSYTTETKPNGPKMMPSKDNNIFKQDYQKMQPLLVHQKQRINLPKTQQQQQQQNQNQDYPLIKTTEIPDLNRNSSNKNLSNQKLHNRNSSEPPQNEIKNSYHLGNPLQKKARKISQNNGSLLPQTISNNSHLSNNEDTIDNNYLNKTQKEDPFLNNTTKVLTQRENILNSIGKTHINKNPKYLNQQENNINLGNISSNAIQISNTKLAKINSIGNKNILDNKSNILKMPNQVLNPNDITYNKTLQGKKSLNNNSSQSNLNNLKDVPPLLPNNIGGSNQKNQYQKQLPLQQIIQKQRMQVE